MRKGNNLLRVKLFFKRNYWFLVTLTEKTSADHVWRSDVENMRFKMKINDTQGLFICI